MSTTLFEQLQRLKAPQTGAIQDAKRKASILFEPKEAAGKDRRTIYDLGVNGLQELIVLNSKFQQFEETLFDENTLHLERAVEHKDVNELLDKNIKKFLQHLSPYFLLRPAHMCLEWLIRRFQIHEYNRKELMALVLPYHETNAFVKVIQTFKLKESDKEWFWLKPLQKPGKPLSKSAVLNRAATDKGFLNFICNSTLEAIKEFGPHAHLLQTQLNFYGSVLVGALEAASSIQEWHISTLLPSLLKGLSSGCIDFVSAAYIIAARLVARTQLTPKLCHALITKVSAVSFDRLRRTAVLLLIWIFDSQKSASPKFSDQTLLHLVQQNWLTTILASLAKENVDVQALVVPLIKDSVHAVQIQHANAQDFKSFLETLLNDIEFPVNSAQQIISSFLDCYVADQSPIPSASKTNSLNDGDVIELDSEDDEDVNMSSGGNINFQSWYSQYLHKLERQYPTAFDLTIKESLSRNDQSSNRSRAIKMALGYRLQSFDSSACDIYESLYHHTADVRLMAVKTLLKNLKNYQKRSQNLQILKECLADRINDDSEEIVNEILKLSSEEIKQIMGCQKFVEALIAILYRIQITPKQWSSLSVKVVKHLTSEEVIQEYDNNLILMALMCLLFPIEGEGVTAKAIKEIIKSPLAGKIKFLQDLQADEENFNVNEFKKHFLDVIAAAKDTPTAVELFESVAKQGETYFKQAMQLYHFILLVTACLKQRYSANQSLQMFKQISLYSKKFQIKHLGKQNWKTANRLKFIPLQLFCDFLVTLTIHTNFQDLLKQCWESPNALELQYFLNIFQYVAEECFNAVKDEAEQLEWSSILKELFDTVFQDPFSKAGFLVNFFVYEDVNTIDNYKVLRLRAFKLMQSLMQNNYKHKMKLSSLHVLKVCIALSSKSQIMRLEALETLKLIYNDDVALNDTLKTFVKAVLERSEEISMDYEQFPLVLFAILKSSKASMGNKVLQDILELLKKDKSLEQAVLSQQLLQFLILFNDVFILSHLLPLALTALQKYELDGSIKLLKEPYSEIFRLIADHFNSQTMETVLMDEPKAWQLIENVFQNNMLFTVVEGNLKPVPCVFLEALDEYALEKMPNKHKQDFLKLIIKTLAEAENDTIFLAVNKLLKKCALDCRPLKEMIESMCKNKEEDKSKSPSIKKSFAKRDANKSLEVQINSLNWKQGVVLMELLENKKKLEHSEYLIPALFELLDSCLSVEEQTTVEYTKQLVLSAILHCCQKASEDGCNLQTALPKTTFRMDQVVQCLRASQNPQTHHNALLLLSHCAALFPQQVLHNIVDIFTFMGSSVVRHDDAFSFHIINDIIESIVPILVKEKSAVVPVLKVFSDIMLDVPEHRRLPLYTKLIETLDSDKYLWMFLCVVFDAHVIDDEKQRLLQKKSHKSSTYGADQVAKRIEIALELTNTFKPQTIIETCIQLMKYIEQLPMQKEDQTNSRKSLKNLDNLESYLFDVNTRSAKQLRHYKYVIMQFLSAITSAQEFLRQIALLTDEDILIMKPFYQNFIIRILSFVPVVTATIEKSEDSSQQKFWKVILHHLHDVLDNAISLLSPEMFLVVVNGLLQHQLLSIRKKVIELLISKLQQKDVNFMACDAKHFHNLLKPLADIVAGILTRDEMVESSQQNELVFLQQTALIAIKLLSKYFALTHIAEFKDILGNLTKIAKHRTAISKIVLATVVLCMIEISSNLKVHSLAHLPKFMPQMIEILQDQAELVRSHPPDNVCIAIVTGMQKLFETLPLFLGPYIVDIITALSSIGTRITAQNNEKDQRSINTLQKISTIWSKIATEVPVRILVPSCEKAYNKLMSSKNYSDISVLMKLLHQSLTNANNNDLANVRNELTSLFMEALEFRVQLKDSKQDIDSINSIEAAIIEAFMAWVLKLSESSFRPLYHKLYNWALQGSQQKENILTYFLLTNKIAEALKSLFVLFANDFIEDAARLLNESNANKFDIEPETEYLTIELLKAILGTLFNIFLHDSKDFVNAQRFEYLMPAIVDQLENRLVLEQDSLQKLLSDCIAQLAVDVSNDVLWKQLNYQVLLKTRTSVPEVRIFAFNCCVEIARKLGDDFTPLLPETVPFIAELFEDENPRVEKNTRKSVQELEVILGESLQKYL
ncbi:HEAT repeat-containing protein 1 homolog [Lucilia sericata]|uniref:HEAT repeat-containing protein 1 homolog n=1 Tax=Lucilia sericata TaxID=13632 RepID=UPI0018A7ED15|nr:HEAT repeat-containing protein 1 homolog [Lucilia sericata]